MKIKKDILSSGDLCKCIKEFKALKEDVFLNKKPMERKDTILVKPFDIVVFLEETNQDATSYGNYISGKVSILLIDNKKYYSYNKIKLGSFLEKIEK